ncbi:DUF2188 domain-containing protein [Patescibacteria group bacterium]|nr:DUF2188 domain-containing protein [Patescibacteria group bacterium]
MGKKLPPLPQYTLGFNEGKEKWELFKNKTHQVVKTFTTKEKATKGGVLERALGANGGSVKIQLKESARIQEERTFPGDRDPANSPG